MSASEIGPFAKKRFRVALKRSEVVSGKHGSASTLPANSLGGYGTALLAGLLAGVNAANSVDMSDPEIRESTKLRV